MWLQKHVRSREVLFITIFPPPPSFSIWQTAEEGQDIGEVEGHCGRGPTSLISYIIFVPTYICYNTIIFSLVSFSVVPVTNCSCVIVCGELDTEWECVYSGHLSPRAPADVTVATLAQNMRSWRHRYVHLLGDRIDYLPRAIDKS